MRFLRLVCHMLTQRLRRIIFIDYNRRFRAREPYRVNGIVVRAKQFGSNLLLLPGIELKESWRRQERRICLGSYANEMLHPGTLATFQTTDLEANQIARDENDVKFLILMLDGSWINPFKGEEQDLVCLPSSNLATSRDKEKFVSENIIRHFVMSGLSLTHLSGNSTTKLRTLERMEGRRKIKKEDH